MGAPKVLIGGVDRSARVEFKTVVTTYNLTSQPDTLAFTLRLPEGAQGEVPIAGTEVVLMDGPDKVFGGVITQAPRGWVGSTGEIVVPVQAQDYQTLLTRTLAAETYQNQTAGAIAQNLLGKVAGFAAVDVQAGEVIPKWAVNYQSVSDALTQLATTVGFDWYVDVDKGLHFYDATRAAPVAAWDLSEDAAPPYAASAAYGSFSYTEDVTQLRNAVTVRGARTESQLSTQTVRSSGVERTFILNLGEVVAGSLTMNIGGAPQLIGEEGTADPATVDWLVNYKNRSVFAAKAGTPTPPNGTQISFTYRYFSQIITQAEDSASIARYGRWEYVYVNEQIKTRDVANRVARAQLATYAVAAESLTYATSRPGLVLGARQRVTLPRLGVSGTYLIKSLDVRIEGWSNTATAHQPAGYQRRWTVRAEKLGSFG